MTISGKALAIADWVMGYFPLLVVLTIGPLEKTIGVALIIGCTWTALFTYLGIKAWKSAR